jgi:GAF domain-containing protein
MGAHVPAGGDLAAVFASVQSLLLTVGNLDSFLQDLAEVAAEVALGLSCGITLQREAEPLTVASSDERAQGLDESQYAVNEGPCLHALRTGEPVSMSDLRTDQRWPDYVSAARGQGLRSSLSLPLTVQGRPFGAMNLYSFTAAGTFEGDLRRRSELFAAQASGALELAAQKARDSELRDQLEQALESRAVIDQALGILMGQQRCTSQEAFDLLRRRSQTSHGRLRDVAAELIVRVTGEDPQPGKRFEP